jgi:hypothetical protein
MTTDADNSATEPEPRAASQPHSPQTREAQQAHGGSMAPGVVDPAGRPLREPPQAQVIEEEAGSTDE